MHIAVASAKTKKCKLNHHKLWRGACGYNVGLWVLPQRKIQSGTNQDVKGRRTLGPGGDFELILFRKHVREAYRVTGW